MKKFKKKATNKKQVYSNVSQNDKDKANPNEDKDDEKNGEIKPSLLMANKIRVKPYNNTNSTVINPANTPVATKVDAQV